MIPRIGRPHEDPAAECEAFLAGEVVDLVAGDGGRLAALRSAVLWPWELDVAARADAFLWAPSDLVVLTVGALHGRVPVRP